MGIWTLLGLCILNGMLLGVIWWQRRNQTEMLRMLREMRVLVERVRTAQMRTLEMLEKQAMAEQVIDKGSVGVETVHKAIAGLTFGILEAIPQTRATSAVVREVHDFAAGGSYEAVRAVNREIGKVLKEAMVGLPKKGGSPR